MIIVTNLGQNVNEYKVWLEALAAGLRWAVERLPRTCSVCGGRFQRYGKYPRYAGFDLIAVQRVYCKACRKTHAVLPSFLAPYRPYEMFRVERVFNLRLAKASWSTISRYMPEVPLRVMQRWMQRIRKEALKAAGFLLRGIKEKDPGWGGEKELGRSSDELGVLKEAALTLFAAYKALAPEMVLDAGRLLEFVNVYLNLSCADLWL